MPQITSVALAFLLLLPYFAEAEPQDAPPPRVEAQVVSELRVSYDNVYGVELNLPFAGDVEASAVDGDDIHIRLEKHGQGIHQEAIETYLNNVTLETVRADDILLLNPIVPPPTDAPVILTRLNCFIETPPDISLRIKISRGDIRVHGVRGNMDLAVQTGNIQLDETMGKYQASVKEGQIDGKILLSSGDNSFRAESGSINLTALDEIAAPMDITADNGEITLRLPENYPAEIEVDVESDSEYAASINMPAEIERAFVGEPIHGWINGGGPLIRLKARNRVAILAIEPPETEEPEDAGDVDDIYDESEPNPVPSVDAPRTPQSPVIDGNLLEKAWANAALLGGFYLANGQDPPEEPTRALLLWDDQYLYIGVRAYDSQMKQARITEIGRDGAVWRDDAIEILIDPNPETAVYYHIAVNPIGAMFDEMITDEYPPDAQFEPTDAPLRDSSVYAPGSAADPTWDCQAQVKTQITATYWTVEAAIKRDAMESPASEEWEFNLHRKTRRLKEYSFWSPTYDEETPWWPHWPERLGVIRFVDENKGEAPADGDDTERFEIAEIAVDGNAAILASEILQTIPFQRNDVINVRRLAWLNLELSEWSWFSDARLETTSVADEENVPASGAVFRIILRVRVTEAPTRVVKQIDLQGDAYFDATTVLRNGFGLTVGRMALADLETKSELIANLYRRHGYDLARVNYQLTDERLEINIDEGHLDEIRFSGYRQIPLKALVNALGIKRGDAYRRQIGALSINQMRERLSENLYFKDIKKWEARREGDLNVFSVEIQEQPVVSLKPRPIFNFNRVHGLILGGRSEVSSIRAQARLFGQASYGFSSEIWNYKVGGEKAWFSGRPLRIGGSVFKLTDTNDYSRLSSDKEFLSAAIFGEAFLDYYQREGFSLWATQKLTPSTALTLSVSEQEDENLFKSTDWSLLGRNKPKRSNIRVDEGRFRVVEATYHFDTRGRQSSRRRESAPNGWLGDLSIERKYSLGAENDDAAFTLYRFRAIRYNRLSVSQYLNFRLEGGISSGPLLRQNLLYLGGVSALRGYDFKEFVGDNMLLFNLEYRVHFGRTVYPNGREGNLGAVTIFVDTGYAWFDNREFALDRFNASVGLGLSLFADEATGLRFEAARALRKKHGITPILRLSRMF